MIQMKKIYHSKDIYLKLGEDNSPSDEKVNNLWERYLGICAETNNYWKNMANDCYDCAVNDIGVNHAKTKTRRIGTTTIKRKSAKQIYNRKTRMANEKILESKNGIQYKYVKRSYFRMGSRTEIERKISEPTTYHRPKRKNNKSSCPTVLR